MENLVKMYDLGLPLFLETPIYRYIISSATIILGSFLFT